MIATTLNLQQTTAIAHHPIITERTLRFQAEDFLQPSQTRSRTMKVFFRGCRPAVALVVLRQVLGFEYRRILGRNRKWRCYYARQLKKRTALVAKLKEIFRQRVSQPLAGVIEQINPILRGWVNYFAVGDSSECSSFVRDWVEKKVRGHLMRARERSGFGWTKWSRTWLYEKLGLYYDYRFRRPWSLLRVQSVESAI